MITAEPNWWHRALHLGAIWGLAMGKPLLDATNESGFFWLPRAAAPIDIVLIALIVLFVVPALLFGIEYLVSRVSAQAGDVLHLALIALLLGILFLQILGSFHVKDPSWSLPLSALLAAAGTALYARTTFLPQVLDVLSPAPVLFLVLFLFFSPSTGLWMPGSDPETADVEVEQDPPIVMLVLDELPTTSLLSAPDKIDESLFPNFAELGNRATWYENATTVADETENALPAILTGRQPDDEEKPMPTARAFPENVFTLLGGAYDIDAVETVTQLCPHATCDRQIRDGFGERFGSIAGDLTRYTPAAVLPTRVHNKIFGMGSDISPLPDTTPQELFDLLLDDVQGEPGQFDFLHAANLPHKPWTLVPSLESYTPPDELDEDLGASAVAYAAQDDIDERKRHLLQVGAADKLLGEVMAKMDAEGTWDDSLVIVMADHGISFKPDTGRRRASSDNLDQIAFVPLFVKLPGQQKGGADPSLVETVDVVPIIADTLGIDMPWEVDGVLPGERTDPKIEVDNFKGNPIGANFKVLRASRDQFTAQWNKLLKTGAGWNELIESGQGSKLIGRQIPPDIPESEATATINGLQDEGDPGRVSAVISGRIDGLSPGKRLAIAVNGRIAATTGAVGTYEGLKYEAVLPPRVYEKPIETVQVLRALAGHDNYEVLATATVE